MYASVNQTETEDNDLARSDNNAMLPKVSSVSKLEAEVMPLEDGREEIATWSDEEHRRLSTRPTVKGQTSVPMSFPGLVHRRGDDECTLSLISRTVECVFWVALHQ